MITIEQLELEQNRRLAKIVKINRTKIKRVYEVLKGMNMPNVEFQEFLVDMKQPITSDTKLVFIETSYVGRPVRHERRYHHFIDRGLVTNSAVQYSYLYLAVFKNKITGECRIKLGITGKPNIEDRFRQYSDTWEFVGWLCQPRKGEKREIEELEKELKRYCSRNSILSENVQDFTFGGKTELLMPLVAGEHLRDILNIFTKKCGFDSL